LTSWTAAFPTFGKSKHSISVAIFFFLIFQFFSYRVTNIVAEVMPRGWDKKGISLEAGAAVLQRLIDEVKIFFGNFFIY
jgi:hypothetical protein